MRRCALVMIGLGVATAAAAQTAAVDMVPMQGHLPSLLFAPDPIAGTMLKPLRNSGNGAPEVAPEPNDQTVTRTATPAERPDTEVTGAIAPAETAVPTEESAATTVEPATPAAESALEPATPTEAASEPATALAEPMVPGVPAETTASAGSSVHVIVENVGSAAGIVNVAVCDTALSEDGCPFKKSAPASQGFVEMTLDGIPPGNYAVVGYHDVNGNDEFDKFLGMPREPYALSSTAAESLVPRFQDAAMPIKEGENVVIIRLKSFGGG